MLKVEVGSVFGRLIVTRLIPDAKNPKAECRCECGAVVTPQRGALRNGRAKSCGCLRAEQNRTVGVTHGGSSSPEYRVFKGMQARCNNPQDTNWHNYGGRGIQVLWTDFESFMRDVGPRPAGAWIERLDNDGHYGSGNCAWVVPAQNQINKRVSRIWTINGVDYESSPSAARALGVTPSAVVRGCNGYTRAGRAHAPRDGWSSRLKYPESSCALVESGLLKVSK